MPPKVQKVPSPSSTATLDDTPSPDLRVTRDPDDNYSVSPPDLNPILETLVEKAEDAHKKLDSLKPFLQSLESTLKDHCDRLTEVEKVALAVDLGKAPSLPESMYLGLTSKDIFLTVLGSAIQALITSFPTVFRDAKTNYRNSHLMTAVEVAIQAVSACKERLPKME